MPSDAVAAADYGYDTARDIYRIWTAFGTLFLPLCFFGMLEGTKISLYRGFLKNCRGKAGALQ